MSSLSLPPSLTVVAHKSIGLSHRPTGTGKQRVREKEWVQSLGRDPGPSHLGSCRGYGMDPRRRTRGSESEVTVARGTLDPSQGISHVTQVFEEGLFRISFRHKKVPPLFSSTLFVSSTPLRSLLPQLSKGDVPRHTVYLVRCTVIFGTLELWTGPQSMTGS